MPDWKKVKITCCSDVTGLHYNLARWLCVQFTYVYICLSNWKFLYNVRWPMELIITILHSYSTVEPTMAPCSFQHNEASKTPPGIPRQITSSMLCTRLFGGSSDSGLDIWQPLTIPTGVVCLMRLILLWSDHSKFRKILRHTYILESKKPAGRLLPLWHLVVLGHSGKNSLAPCNL